MRVKEELLERAEVFFAKIERPRLAAKEKMATLRRVLARDIAGHANSSDQVLALFTESCVKDVWDGMSSDQRAKPDLHEHYLEFIEFLEKIASIPHPCCDSCNGDEEYDDFEEDDSLACFDEDVDDDDHDYEDACHKEKKRWN